MNNQSKQKTGKNTTNKNSEFSENYSDYHRARRNMQSIVLVIGRQCNFGGELVCLTERERCDTKFLKLHNMVK